MHLVRHLPPQLRAPLTLAISEGWRAWRAVNWRPPLDIDAIAAGPLVVSGLMNEVVGIGRACQMTVSSLRNVGLKPIEHDLRPALLHYPRGGLSLNAPPGGVWLIHANAPETDKALNVLGADDWGNRYRIGYWVWETTKAPRSWVRTAQWLHEIWTPSQFSADAIAASFRAERRHDLIERIRVVPHPAPKIAAHSSRSRFGLPADCFVALSSFDGRSTFARKNPFGAISAWKRAFPKQSDEARLIIKSIETAADPASIDALVRLIRDRSDIEILDEKLSDQGIADLIASVDLVISLSRSEGFGLPLAEAMALGRAVLTTNYSAPLEFLDETCAYLCAANEVPVVDPSGFYEGGNWSEPDLEDAARTLRRIFESPDERAEKGRKAQLEARKLDTLWNRTTLDQAPWRRLVDNSPNHS